MDVPRLRQFFKFDESDLNANRNGRLSEKQSKRLMAEARAERKSARESAVILLVIASFGIGVGLLIALNASTWTGRILIGLTLCLLWPLAWGGKAWNILQSVPLAREDQVRTARGSVRVLRHEDDFVLELEGRQFDVEKNPSKVIKDGDEIIVYFLERTEEILSLEAL